MKAEDEEEVEVFEVAQGAHVGITKPEDGFQPRNPVQWEKFVNLVTAFTVSDSKVGEYVCRPMGGDGCRSDANALPWPLLPLDLDELLPEDLSELERWCKEQGLDLVLATTFSHTTESPRVRLWVHCSRAFSATEHLFLFRSFSQGTFFPFKLDPATAKPSQPIYLPRCPPSREHLAFAKYYKGKRLDVDAVLKGFRAEMREVEERNKKGRFVEGKGARAPGGTVDCFNKHFDLTSLLEAHGYKRRTRNRFIAPGSKSGRAAVVVHEWGLTSFHEPSHDLLAVRTTFGTPRVLDPFAVFAVLEHDDDFIPAWKAAARLVRERGWEVIENETQKEFVEGFLIQGAKDAIASMSPREMLVENLLEKGTVVLVTGQSNSGKTTILQYLLLCISQGLKFGPHRTVQGRVLWIAGEDSYNARIRIAAMCTEYGVPIDSLNDSYFILANAIKVLNRASMEAFHAAVDKYILQVSPHHPPSVVVLDSKSMCWGGEDENSNDENSLFVQELGEHFTSRYGASVIVTHHLTKSKEKEEQTARGASALINNIDHEWRFEMRLTSMVSIMEPGSKLRIARWEPMRFQVKVVELQESDYPNLKNSQGNMPSISVAEVTNKYGVSSKKQQEDADYAAILKVLPGIDVKARRSLNLAIARGLGKVSEGVPKPSADAAKDWVRVRIKKMQEQKLLDEQCEVTDAGRQFLEQYEADQASPVAGAEVAPDEES